MLRRPLVRRRLVRLLIFNILVFADVEILNLLCVDFILNSFDDFLQAVLWWRKGLVGTPILPDGAESFNHRRWHRLALYRWLLLHLLDLRALNIWKYLLLRLHLNLTRGSIFLFFVLNSYQGPGLFIVPLGRHRSAPYLLKQIVRPLVLRSGDVREIIALEEPCTALDHRVDSSHRWHQIADDDGRLDVFGFGPVIIIGYFLRLFRLGILIYWCALCHHLRICLLHHLISSIPIVFRFRNGPIRFFFAFEILGIQKRQDAFPRNGIQCSVPLLQIHPPKSFFIH